MENDEPDRIIQALPMNSKRNVISPSLSIADKKCVLHQSLSFTGIRLSPGLI